MFVNAKASVLLQAAKACASAPSSPQNTTIARLLFDSGSQRSYIASHLRDTLALPTISKETLNIKTFGSDEGSLKTCEFVH